MGHAQEFRPRGGCAAESATGEYLLAEHLFVVS